MTDAWIWSAARGYSVFRGVVHRTTGIHLKGLGFLLRHLRTSRTFEALGFRWFLDPRIGGAFANLLGGSYLEPETQDFLHHVADKTEGGFVFVDVGANVGEMVVPMGSHPNCSRVIAFEPHPVCAEALRQSLALNEIRDAEVRPVVVGDGTPQPYVIDAAASPNSGIRPGAQGIELTPTTTLDDELIDVRDCVILIDVEGSELDVMRGGRTFIRQSRPLIIFEYHDRTRERFALSEVLEVIGAGYELFRLRTDGRLDTTLSGTWNCVAVHTASWFWPAARERMIS